jgi:hypothetical protein
MKQAFLFFSLLLPSLAFAQVNILDSNVAYDSLSSQNVVTVFLSVPSSNSDLSTLDVKIGTTYGASDIYSSTYTVGTNVDVSNNKLQVTLSGVSSGEYFVAVTITRASDSSTEVMQYRMQ